MEVVKLRGLAQDVGHQVIGGLKFLQDGEVRFHESDQGLILSRADGTKSSAICTCSGPIVLTPAWAAAIQAARARRLSRRGLPLLAPASKSRVAALRQGRSNPTWRQPWVK